MGNECSLCKSVGWHCCQVLRWSLRDGVSCRCLQDLNLHVIFVGVCVRVLVVSLHSRGGFLGLELQSVAMIYCAMLSQSVVSDSLQPYGL